MRLHGRAVPMVGLRFGRLVVIRLSTLQSHKSGRHLRWVCKCDCGREHTASGTTLRRGDTQSCGCLKSERISAYWKSYREKAKNEP